MPSIKAKNSCPLLLCSLLLSCAALSPQLYAQSNIVDEVMWMVGDEPILKSDIEYQKLYILSQGVQLDKDPDCYIPEQMAVQMLFLNQAKIDSISVDETIINRQIDAQMENLVSQLGSREKVEEYFNKNFSQIKLDQRRILRDGEIVQQMQQTLVRDLTVSPSEIRSFFASIPPDSLPFIPTRLEVRLISRKPEVKLSEIDRIKARLRDFSQQINEGTTSFSTLARLYSEDSRTATQGGEYGFVAKSSLEDEFARIVFDMSPGQRVSPIIESEEGYHIVQLIEKRGDMVNMRHILLRPKYASTALEGEIRLLDSIASEITSGRLLFNQAVTQYSQDEKTKNNAGLMVNEDYQSALAGSSFFALEELPQELSQQVANLRPGELTHAFTMLDSKGNKRIVIAQLLSRQEAHRADLTKDFQIIKQMALEDKRMRTLADWVREKQKTTFVEINPRYRNCQFEYPGWVK